VQKAKDKIMDDKIIFHHYVVHSFVFKQSLPFLHTFYSLD